MTGSFLARWIYGVESGYPLVSGSRLGELQSIGCSLLGVIFQANQVIRPGNFVSPVNLTPSLKR